MEAVADHSPLWAAEPEREPVPPVGDPSLDALEEEVQRRRLERRTGEVSPHAHSSSAGACTKVEGVEVPVTLKGAEAREERPERSGHEQRDEKPAEIESRSGSLVARRLSRPQPEAARPMYERPRYEGRGCTPGWSPGGWSERRARPER